MAADTPTNPTNPRPQFGNRFLTSEDDVFQHNAWDNVEWNEEQEQQASSAVEKNAKEKLCSEDADRFLKDANKFWDSFYSVHQDRFFKDRHWLFTEFPELNFEKDRAGRDGSYVAFELGCGVGNTLLPILKYNSDPNLKLYGCDFSEKAIDILCSSPEFDKQRCHAFVMDACSEAWDVPFAKNSIDVIIMIFVLSAIKPSNMQNIIKHCFEYLRPGGIVLFRDYGRYDLAQLRFKSGKCLEDNFYVRGDGTMVYFFTQEEIRNLFCSVGFEEEQNTVDRRLQVNRGRMLKMYRVWIQTKYRKPIIS